MYIFLNNLLLLPVKEMSLKKLSGELVVLEIRQHVHGEVDG